MRTLASRGPGCESRAIPLCHSACYGACQASTCSTGSLASTCGSERSIRRVGQGGRRPGAGPAVWLERTPRVEGIVRVNREAFGDPGFLFLSGAPWRWRTALHKSVGRVYIMNMHPPAPSPPDRNDKTERARESAKPNNKTGNKPPAPPPQKTRAFPRKHSLAPPASIRYCCASCREKRKASEGFRRLAGPRSSVAPRRPPKEGTADFSTHTHTREVG